MNILIAGGAGFLGSHLVDAHIARGDVVTVFDNLSTGKLHNLDAAFQTPLFSFSEVDICDPLPPTGSIDIIYHLASPASPKAYLQRPLGTLRVGSEGTFRLLELARSNKARFVLASTSEVYGDPLVHPQTETYRANVEPTSPRSVYDEAKRFAEASTSAFAREHSVNTAIARIFNTYGPRLDIADGRVVSNFITQALAGSDVTIYGTGKQTRSLCFVSNMVSALMALADADLPGPINLGNPDERSVLEIAQIIIEACSSNSPIKFEALPTDDPARRCPDIGRARSLLSWEPVMDLRQGLDETIQWFRLLNQPK